MVQGNNIIDPQLVHRVDTLCTLLEDAHSMVWKGKIENINEFARYSTKIFMINVLMEALPGGNPLPVEVMAEQYSVIMSGYDKILTSPPDWLVETARRRTELPPNVKFELLHRDLNYSLELTLEQHYNN